jgi:hypothetical protein
MEPVEVKATKFVIAAAFCGIADTGTIELAVSVNSGWER